MQNYQTAVARIFLALVFLGAVILRLLAITSHPNGYIDYQVTLGQVGLPSIFAPLLILVQLVAGIGLLVGYKTRLFAYVLAGLAFFLAIVLGRFDFQSMFIYLGITGGMLLLATHYKTGFSIDNTKKDRLF
ncbi:MAG TPA: DoxX family protein [Methylotenera sp.]|nr:DoxX family protein [Methylotenera sp.]